jgi:hypothetical protein
LAGCSPCHTTDDLCLRSCGPAESHFLGAFREPASDEEEAEDPAERTAFQAEKAVGTAE